MSDLALLEARLAERFGLRPRDDWPKRIQQAVDKLANRVSGPSDQRMERLCAEDALLRELAGDLTVKETYFFRHPRHFDFLMEYLAGRLGADPGPQSIRVWSAGCSTGDEPYTVAMLALERLPQMQCARLEILGTDVRRAAIEHAERGLYARWAFRELSAQRLGRNFTERKKGQYELRPAIRRMVSFRHLSLQEHLAALSANTIDSILFRNVAVYLTDSCLERLYRGFARVLKPNGLLLIAATDPRPPADEFHLDDPSETTILRPGPRAESAKATRSSAPPSSSKRTIVPRRSARPSPPRAARPSTDAAPPLRVELDARLQGSACQTVVGQARALADRGRNDQAVALLDQLTRQQPADAAGHLCRGQIQLAAGDPQEAVADLRRALYLEPADPLARYWYAIALQRSGRCEDALRHLTSLRRQLGPTPPGTPLSDGDTTAGELLRAAGELEEVFR